jgi:hypothetical protein
MQPRSDPIAVISLCQLAQGEASPQHFVSDLFEPRLNCMTNIGCKQIQILSPAFSMKGCIKNLIGSILGLFQHNRH